MAVGSATDSSATEVRIGDAETSESSSGPSITIDKSYFSLDRPPFPPPEVDKMSIAQDDPLRGRAVFKLLQLTRGEAGAVAAVESARKGLIPWPMHYEPREEQVLSREAFGDLPHMKQLEDRMRQWWAMWLGFWFPDD